jgi:hypothetical protein
MHRGPDEGFLNQLKKRLETRSFPTIFEHWLTKMDLRVPGLRALSTTRSLHADPDLCRNLVVQAALAVRAERKKA